MEEKRFNRKEAAKYLGISLGTLSQKVKKGELNPVPCCKPQQFTLSELEAYKKEQKKIVKHRPMQICLAFGESLKIINIHSLSTKQNPLKYNCTTNYAVSNYGRVFNIDKGTELKQSIATHGYLQVALATPKGNTFFRVHDLMSTFWCPNKHGFSATHHINGNKLDNRAENLLCVSDDVHLNVLHPLLEKAKQTNMWSDYFKKINEIRKDNEFENDYACIPFEKDNSIIFAWIPKVEYDLYCCGEKSLYEIEYPSMDLVKVIPKVVV